ncbi:protein kinase domain-containing protein [Sorangium sp. So ce385]|uniref:serine/threonine-protein kinase n=1 Tax=Sorangium sp. So ce385 TaxID=3133308 RepID=UPI003F5C5519
MHRGQLFSGRFELVARAGSGGMGTVWRALDGMTGRPVALKLLTRVSDGDTARFRHEARILAGLSHPHVVHYVAHGVGPSGEPYLAMEWLDGETLADRLDGAGLTLEESLSLAHHVASALAEAHVRGIVHRDIKPNNLLLVGGEIDRVKVLDFGIAWQSGATRRLTQTGSILGTPGYMAPEQARAEREVGPPVDVFALGCVLFECLTGKPAFQGEHLMALLAKLLLEEPPRLLELRPDVPAGLADLVERMLAKEPAERPADGAAVLAALRSMGADAEPRSRAEVRAGPPSITRAERRLVSIVAVAPALDQRGDEARTIVGEETIPTARTRRARGSPRGFVDAVRRAAVPLGARVEELANGVVVAVLLGEGSVTDQAAAGARCALWVRSATDAAIVLVTGRGEATNRLPVGEALERAAALLDEARGLGGRSSLVRIDDVTRALLDSRFQVVEEAGRILLQDVRPIGDESRTLLGKPSPFVGRDRELRSVVDLIEGSFEERRPVALLVTAPPGMGKSRLRQEIVRVVRGRHPDVALAMARPDALGAGSAFAMLSEALRGALAITAGETLSSQQEKIKHLVSLFHSGEEARQIAEFLGELVGTPFPDEDSPRLRAARQSPQLMAEQVEAAYVRLIAAVAGTRPVLLVLEDLHWGDAPSIKIVDAALRDLDDRPFAVIAFARPSVHDAFPRLWATRNAHQIRLNELSRRAAAELVQRMLGGAVEPSQVAAIVERSGGNAFYIEELIRAVAEGRGETLPDTVLGMVEARLAALAPEARRLLRAASIFGEVFWKGGVRALLGEDEPVDACLAQLCDDELITWRIQSRFAGEEEYALRHALLREGAYAMLADRDRPLGHKLAGAWLERAGERDPVVLAEHFERGGEGARAAEFYLAAAEQALRGADLRVAIDRAERGIACGASVETVGALRAVQAEAGIYLSDHVSAYEWASQALSVADPSSASYCRALGFALISVWNSGRSELLGGLMQRLSTLEPPRSGLFWVMMAYEQVTYTLLLAGMRDAAHGCLQRMERFVAEAGGVDASIRGWLELSRGAWSRHAERDAFRALSHNREALRCFELGGDRRYLLNAQIYVEMSNEGLGALEEAEQSLTRALASESARGYHGAIVVYHLAFVLLQRGKHEQAIELLESYFRDVAGAVVDQMIAMMRVVLCAAQLRSGRLDLAEAAVRELGEPSAHPLYLAAALSTVLAELRLAQGRAEEAVKLTREIRDRVRSIGTSPCLHEFDLPLIHVLALQASGDSEGARAALRAERDDLLAQAAAIPDPAYRRSFLEGLPARARLLALAREQLDGQPGIQCVVRA